MHRRSISIPLEALMPGDAGKPSPSVGEVIEITTSAKVTSLEGGRAVVRLETINGLPFGEDPLPEGEDEGAIRQLAESADDDTWPD